jgi:hypothetical protein
MVHQEEIFVAYFKLLSQRFCLEVLRNTISQRRSPGLCPGQPMLTLVKKVTLGHVFLLLLGISPVIIISTVTLHTYISPEGWTISPMVAAVQRQSHPIGMNNNKLIKCLTLGNQSPWYLPSSTAMPNCLIIRTEVKKKSTQFWTGKRLK